MSRVATSWRLGRPREGGRSGPPDERAGRLASASVMGVANPYPAHFETLGEFRLERGKVKGHIGFGRGAWP